MRTTAFRLRCWIGGISARERRLYGVGRLGLCKRNAIAADPLIVCYFVLSALQLNRLQPGHSPVSVKSSGDGALSLSRPLIGLLFSAFASSPRIWFSVWPVSSREGRSTSLARP